MGRKRGCEGCEALIRGRVHRRPVGGSPLANGRRRHGGSRSWRLHWGFSRCRASTPPLPSRSPMRPESPRASSSTTSRPRRVCSPLSWKTGWRDGAPSGGSCAPSCWLATLRRDQEIVVVLFTAAQVNPEVRAAWQGLIREGTELLSGYLAAR